ECVAPGLFLTEEDRDALSKIQSDQFETTEQMKAATSEMKSASQSDKVNDLAQKDKDKYLQNGNEHYQEEAQQAIEESAISQEQDMEMDGISG
ncbi:type IV conjugative transfer system coupling protein TraD, partial [Vibrio cortegadensis]